MPHRFVAPNVLGHLLSFISEKPDKQAHGRDKFVCIQLLLQAAGPSLAKGWYKTPSFKF